MPTTPLPLQRIETIDEPHDRSVAQATQLGLPFLEEDFNRQAHRDDFRNMLIWGDNKLVMASLLEEFRGKIDLIYIDPPFDVGADFTLSIQIGEQGEAFEKEQSILESVAYRDTWGKGTGSYIHMMYERLLLARETLSDRGSIYVHCDWRVEYLLKDLLIDVFGKGNLFLGVLSRSSARCYFVWTMLGKVDGALKEYGKILQPSFQGKKWQSYIPSLIKLMAFAILTLLT